MNKKLTIYLSFLVIVSLILTSCKSKEMIEPINTLSKSITQVPTIEHTSTPLPTMVIPPTQTITPDFYTKEERFSDGKTWFADNFLLDVYGDNGEGMCIPPMANLDKFNAVIIVLPAVGGDLEFGGRNYSRISPNIWSIASHEEIFGVFSSTTLEFSENKITQITTITSTSSEESTCTNIWIPIEN